MISSRSEVASGNMMSNFAEISIGGCHVVCFLCIKPLVYLEDTQGPQPIKL